MTTSLSKNAASHNKNSTVGGIVLDGLICLAAPVAVLSCASVLSHPNASFTANIIGLAAIVGTGLLSVSKAGDICSDIVNAVSKNSDYQEQAVSNIGNFIARVQEKRGSQSALKPRRHKM